MPIEPYKKSKWVKTDFVCPRCGAKLITPREKQHYKSRLVDRDPYYSCPKCHWWDNESNMDLDTFVKDQTGAS